MEATLSKDSWTLGTWCGFDTETTGLSPKRDRIATATVILRAVGETPEERDRVTNWIINPGIPMPPAASAVNGLTDEFLRENGAEPALALEEIASALARAMAGGTPLVGYNISYDLGMLEADLRRNGLETLRSRLGGRIFPVIDPLVLDRVVDRYRKGKRNLAANCAFYGVAPRGDFHNAEADVIATLDLLEKLLQHHPRVGQLNIQELFDFQQQGHHDWAESYNAFMASRNPRFFPNALGWPMPQDRHPLNPQQEER